MNILDFIFPKKCFACGKGDCYICSDCLSKVETVKPFCPVCTRSSVDGMTHAKCKTPQSLNGLISLYRFEGVIRKAILELKYKFVSDTTKELTDLICKNLNDIYHLTNVTLIPIPLHKSRERWRGFNQSEVLGKLVAEKMGWGFESKLLIRSVATKSQTELKKEDRGENVRGVFKLNEKHSIGPQGFSLLQGETFILFDDVWTTGSTMKEACKVLKRGGAQNVWGLTVCR